MLLPDPTDPGTVLTFARFTYDAYFEPDDKGWVPVPGWNVTGRFGWQTGGIRGYLFVDDALGILVIVIKGTSLATPVGSGPTAQLDKLNDNLMFSCCCAKAGWEWTPICDCPRSSSECSASCLLRESNFEGSYYNLAQTIYLAVKEWFPRHTNIWMAGHSLGGALAALVALTNDLPSFSFESPGDLLFASRLGLLPDVADPTDFLDSVPIHHFGNDGDPIFLGLCTGVTSSCYWLDYALETKCHIGKECLYPADDPQSRRLAAMASATSPARLSPRDENVHAQRSIQYHSIEFVIRKFLESATSVPKCAIKPQCLMTECPTWNFVD
ncbi:putative lipase atg15 [Polyrhizophydium stewartii]|uniref:triacylglycerol lipase n=1 Tax=Polyrhizophydium stewartii TaxID=2732419 RepID=A0ABR4MWR7_9FUNG